MFINDRNATNVSVLTESGAALDIKDVSGSDAMMVGAGIIGAGVLGTSLMVAAYVAPLPVLGGTAVALGLGIGASMTGDGETKSDDKVTTTETETEADPVTTTTVTNYDGVEVDTATI